MWIKVKSSNIKAIRWEKGSLGVQFLNGSEYLYENVTRDQFSRILDADSVGKAFNQIIKASPDLHPFIKVG